MIIRGISYFVYKTACIPTLVELEPQTQNGTHNRLVLVAFSATLIISGRSRIRGFSHCAQCHKGFIQVTDSSYLSLIWVTLLVKRSICPLEVMITDSRARGQVQIIVLPPSL